MTTSSLILIILVTVVLTAVITSLLTSRKLRLKISYMLDALEDKELNFRFDEKKVAGRKFNTTLNRLRNIFDSERREIIQQEKYFGLMLDHVKTGIAVVKDDGGVDYCNNTALVLLGITTLSHIRQLRTISDSLYESFKTITDGSEQRASFYNEAGKMTITLTSSEAMIGKEMVRIIAFNDISSEIAANEEQSWSKLIRVLTHEIMNTITPIASLSETLLDYNQVDREIKNGLSTISQSARGLINFVESYRNLTRVAAPVKRSFYLKDLIERSFRLANEYSEGTQLRYIEKSDDIILYADENQILQIVVNLIKNAIQAEANIVEITAEIDSLERVVVKVSNNGRPISKESQNEIFVPFFTTKQDGSGIGLSLSRQIMRLHNGSISLVRSNEKITEFMLTFA
ncbi:MAG: PAS domain-containing protein [Bacteroidales bacterium]|nr:PAS domain-containing protein [Bacteroidales bacterium]